MTRHVFFGFVFCFFTLFSYGETLHIQGSQSKKARELVEDTDTKARSEMRKQVDALIQEVTEDSEIKTFASVLDEFYGEMTWEERRQLILLTDRWESLNGQLSMFSFRTEKMPNVQERHARVATELQKVTNDIGKILERVFKRLNWANVSVDVRKIPTRHSSSSIAFGRAEVKFSKEGMGFLLGMSEPGKISLSKQRTKSGTLRTSTYSSAPNVNFSWQLISDADFILGVSLNPSHIPPTKIEYRLSLTARSDHGNVGGNAAAVFRSAILSQRKQDGSQIPQFYGDIPYESRYEQRFKGDIDWKR